MLKRILVPLDVTEYTQAAIREAAEIARNAQAHNGSVPVTLEGLGIVDLTQIPSGRFAYLVPRDEMVYEARDTVHELLDRFEAQLKELGLAENQIERRITEGEPFRKIVHHHVFCDLVVMGSACAFPPVNMDYDTFVNLLFHTSRPVLLVPKNGRKGGRVMMLMDGTAPSSRMLYAYAHLNPYPDQDVIVVHSSYEESYHDLKDLFDRVEDYLQRCGIRAQSLRLDEHLLEGLPALIEEHGVGVVAAGIHSEQMLHRFGRGLHLFPLPVEALMERTGVRMFSVH